MRCPILRRHCPCVFEPAYSQRGAAARQPRLAWPFAGLVVLLFGVAAIGGCRRSLNDARHALLTRIEHEPGCLRIEFDAPVELNEVLLRDAAGGRLIQRFPLGVRRQIFTLPFDDTLPARCTVELDVGKRRIVAGVFRQEPSHFVAAIDVPFGQSRYWLVQREDRIVDVFVPPRGTTALGLWVENRRQSEAHFRWRLVSDRGVRWFLQQPAPSDERLSMQLTRQGDRAALLGESVLHFEFDDALFLPRVALASGTKRATIDCTFEWQDRTTGTTERRQLRLRLREATPEQLSRDLRIEAVFFPTDARGKRRAELPADAVYLDDAVWAAARRWLRPASRLRDPYAPYAYQAVRIRNHSPAAISLTIESEVADTPGGGPLLTFAPPAWKAPRRSATAEHVLRVPAQATATARIPLYVAPDVVPGDYVRRFRLYPLGSRVLVAQHTAPLYVVRSSGWVSAIALGCFVLCPAGWLLFGFSNRHIVQRVGTVGLTSIGLIAGLLFIVSYASALGSNLLTVLLGPFAVFVSGVANEGLTCLLMALVVTLIPVPGSVALASMAIFLINSSVSGQFGITELLFVTVSILLREGFLAASGVTTFWRPGQPEQQTNWHALAWRVALVLGLANAATMLVQFCLVQVLYRLFYAAWYVWSVSLVTGLFYGLVGALLGVRLGIELRRVAQ